MNDQELTAQLRREGFAHTYVWDGEMTLTMDGASQTFRAGDCCDVPPGAIHSAKMRARGCRYLIGER
jgi:quercetin dioxygenase-like cupin family protein